MPGRARRLADGLLAVLAVSIPLSTTGMEGAVLGLGALTLTGLVAGWGRSVVRATPLDGVLGLCGATLALSTLASGRGLPEASGWAKLWIVLTYLVVFWWLRDRAHAGRLVRLLVGAAALAGTYGIVQHFTGADWYRTLLGRPTQVAPRAPGDSGYAVVGFFRSYLTFAHVMVFPLAWAVALALGGFRLGFVAAPLVVVALVFSTARGAWLAALAGMAAVGLLAPATRARRARLAAALAVAAGLAFSVSPDLRAHAGQMLALGGPNAGRVAIYGANLDIVRDRPLLGLGFGRYRRVAGPYYEAYPAADRRSHAHNNFLHLAAEAGLVGLAAFCVVYAVVLLRGRDALARARGPDEWAIAAGAWAGVVAFLAGGVTQYNFGDAEVAVTMWFAVAVLMRCRET